MTLEEQLKTYSDLLEPHPAEDDIRETVLAAKRAWYLGEQASSLSGAEFLFRQAGFIRKRCWMLQAVVLLALWWVLSVNGTAVSAQRVMGILAPVFVILLFPELWRNQNSASMEIEAASYFPIRKIYAARMLLFAAADVLMLSLFFLAASFTLKLTAWMVVVHFFLPMNVTCGICFGCLCSNRADSCSQAVTMSLVWTALWVLIVMDEKVYRLITAPVWAGAVLLSVLGIACGIRRVWRDCEKCWEVDQSWN